jgi:LAO/AO transport system kinase
MSAVPPPSGRRRLTLDDYAAGVLGRDRAVLGKAITLIESSRPEDQQAAQELLERLMPRTGRSIRVGITGVPGAGKSSLIEVLGCRLTAAGHRVAVLAVDPSSPVSGGSILADRTRMVRLSADPNVYIRPSPASGTLGGVAAKTRETMLLCEAAGYDVVLVETVGIGQSETAVADMTDFFLVLLLTGAGDELQTMKRGLLELADLVAVAKADGDNRARAEREAARVRQVLQVLRGPDPGPCSSPQVITCSAIDGTGVDVIWQTVLDRRHELERTGQLQKRRQAQAVRWMWSLVEEGVQRALRAGCHVQAARQAEDGVRGGAMTPARGAAVILADLGLPPG